MCTEKYASVKKLRAVEIPRFSGKKKVPCTTVNEEFHVESVLGPINTDFLVKNATVSCIYIYIYTFFKEKNKDRLF